MQLTVLYIVCYKNVIRVSNTVGVILKDGPLNIVFSDMQCHTEIYYVELYDKILVSNASVIMH